MKDIAVKFKDFLNEKEKWDDIICNKTINFLKENKIPIDKYFKPKDYKLYENNHIKVLCCYLRWGCFYYEYVMIPVKYIVSNEK